MFEKRIALSIRVTPLTKNVVTAEAAARNVNAARLIDRFAVILILLRNQTASVRDIRRILDRVEPAPARKGRKRGS